jgi:hypothetical protein
VTGGAVLIAGLEQVMGRREPRLAAVAWPETAGAVVALEAEREHYRTPQETHVGRSVWKVAGLAAFENDGRMLVHKRPALVYMALEAGLFVA